MLPASNRGAGTNIGFPDICNTPTPAGPVPVPYPNFAMNSMAVATSETVMVNMLPAFNEGTTIPMTSGDEAGSASPVKGPGKYTMGNPIVYVDMLPAINLACPTTGNDMNDGLGLVAVPSSMNVFFTERPLSNEEARALTSIEDASVLSTRIGEVGVVAVRAIAFATPAEVRARIAEVGGARAIVLDLRGCPGGELDASVRLASIFLEDGALVASLVEPDGDRIELRARGGAFTSARVAVLVDATTASGAEIVAGALRHHRRATIAGASTYGKGTAHRTTTLDDGNLGLVVAAWLLPSDESVNGRGVTPDVAAADALAAALSLLA